jgi:hypothetical protein
MDSQINAAALALSRGDPLAALKRVSLREDAPALALRGIAMAQLGELARAKELLRRAQRAFGVREPRARARCLLAQAEVALAARDFGASELVFERALARARETLEAHGDTLNATQARCLEVRRWLLLGRLPRAEAGLERLDLTGAPPMLAAIGELLRADVAVRRLRSAAARVAFERAAAAAHSAAIPALVAEVATARRALEVPAARRLARDGAEPLLLEQVEALLASAAFIVDACRRVVRLSGSVVSLSRRPVLFALARTLAEAWPAEATREQLIVRAFGVKISNASHRARLRVEIGRLRRALRSLAALEATPGGFQLRPLHATSVCVLAPPLDHEHAAVLALLADGQAWSSSALALALGASQRTLQRALLALEGAGTARSLGRGRARRWLAAPVAGFTTILLLPAALPLD